MISVLTTSNWKRPALVLVSLLLSLWHFGPLQATLPALILTVGIQVYLLGYLAARALGLWRKSETIVIRVTWLAACGLGISIVLGAVFRFLLIPVTVYIIALHLLMMALCFVPATSKPPKPISRKTLPFYLLLAFIAVLFVVIGWERNKLRFSPYPDQSYPISLSDYWAYNPRPEAINSRNITESTTATYWSSDGLTYVFAAWEWASGVTAVQLIWYVLTPLFAWLIPLAHFALVYRVTRRTDTAAWATGIVFIFALTTINTPSLLGGAWMYGQEAAFQLSTLRTFSAALLLPLTLFVFFSSLRRPSLKSYFITGVVILALALTHPRQYLVMLTGLYAILGLRWIMRPSKRRFMRLLPLALAILPSLIVPFLQYGGHLQSQITPDIVSDLPGAVSISQQVIEPAMLLFHPFVVLSLILSLFAVIRLRRSLAAQYIVATVAVMLILSYVTPIYNLILLVMNSYFGLHFIFELFFMLPIGLILGLAITTAYDWLVQRTHLHRAVTSGLITALFAVVPLITLIEPFPIPTSARDQLDAAHQMQTIKDIRPFDQALLNRLAALPVTSDKVIYMTTNRVAGYVIESIPHAFVTGGRQQGNPGYPGTIRFFENTKTPWVDTADIRFMQQYGVDYIVLSADNWHVPELELQSERFTRIDAVAGYMIYAVHKPLEVSPLDALFADMNTLYQAEKSPRWTAGGLQMSSQSDSTRWEAMVSSFEQQVKDQPQNDLAQYGLALARLLAGDNSPDVWQKLSAAHPDGALLTETAARLLAFNGEGQAAVDLLYSTFEKSQAEQHVLMAKALLSQPFFSLLTAAQLDSLIATASTDADTWANLMEWNHEDGLRMRVALLMSAGRWDTAAAWLDRLPEVILAPQDLVAQAAIDLVNGKSDTARATLKQAVNIDWIEPHKFIYKNDWSDAGNYAARMYYTLTEPSADELSPNLIAEAHSPFIIQPQVTLASNQLKASAIFGNFTPSLPPKTVLVQVVSSDHKTVFGQRAMEVDIPAGAMQNITLPVELTSNIPSGTPAIVVIKLQYDDTLVYQSVELPTTLVG